MDKILKLLLLIIISFSFAGFSFGQTTTSASITGTVFNEKNEVLPGANIVAVHLPTGTKYVTSTRENGQFTIASARAGGPYRVTISFIGYENTILNDINLILGQNMEILPALKLTGYDINEVVISGKQDPLFNVDHNGSVTNISNQEIVAIPTLTRSLSDMTRLTPQGSSANNFLGRNNLFNNLTINGSLFNNAFGLSSQIGGQTSAQPISLDAIDQIEVSLSPYDVRQSGFSGANINAITKSGTNEFSASLYHYWKNQNYIGENVESKPVTITRFNYYENGFRLGGPIVKNKLFFFLNAEQEQTQTPVSSYNAATPGVTPGGTVTNINASTLDSLKTFLINKFGYDPGSYQNITQTISSNKVLVRLDYNISQSHKLNISYNYLQSSKSNISPSGISDGPTLLYFSNNGYKINNNMNSLVGELNSMFGNVASNNFIIGYSSLKDYRELPSSTPFPMVEIFNNGNRMTSFGTEQYTPNNKLNTNIFQISDNFAVYLGPHTLTMGGSYEKYSFENGFTPQYYGDFQYNSLSDFYADAGTGQKVDLRQYLLNYSAMSDGSVPIAKLKVAQMGVYLQDEYKVNKRFKFSLGLRVDRPFYPVTLPQNPVLDTAKFINQQGTSTSIDVGELPKAKLLYSPRFGFNWDVFGNKKTQVRGGIGIFTGRIPFVWISNQASNNGVLFGQIKQPSVKKASNQYPFSPNINEYKPAVVSFPPSFAINATSPGFQWPQVLRSNIAIDQKLPGGIVGTVEGIYSKTLHDVYTNDWNLKNPTSTRPDGRVVFPSPNKNNSYITNAYVLLNTNEGYSYFITTQLQKSFKFEEKRTLSLKVAYTYSQTQDINSENASTASSQFLYNPVKGNPNTPGLSFADNDQPHKLIGFLSYRSEYLNHMATAISIVYTGIQSGRFSYTYNGDYNNDGQNGNDLIYVPRTNSEINLVKINGDSRTLEQVWNDLDAYIQQDSYLKKHRGQIMQRNGGVYPWLSQFDVKIVQDLFVNVAGKRNTLEFSMDLINAGNWLNTSWGVRKTVNRTSLLNYTGVDAGGNPMFTFPTFNNAALANTFSTTYGTASLWQLQLGLRYIFN